MQSVPITTNVVSSNPAYAIKFVSDLRQGLWFSPVSSRNKTDCHDITGILLKVELNTNPNLYKNVAYFPTRLRLILNIFNAYIFLHNIDWS